MPQDLEKQVRKLLATPEGRAVVGKELGIIIQPPELKLHSILGTEPKVPQVAVLVPCYDHPDPQMTNAYNDLVGHTRRSGLAEVFNGPVVRGASMIVWARNNLIKALLETKRPWTHVLFWDDDIVPPADALVKLLSHQKEIIVGLCTCRTDPPVPNIRYWRSDLNRYEEIIQWGEGLVEIGAGGTGFMLISRHALRQVADAYFDCRIERDLYQMPDQLAKEMGQRRRAHFDQTGSCSWFRCLPYAEGISEMGEDVSFCHIARHYCGLKVYCDTTVQPDHVGTYEFGIKDFLAHRDAWIKDAKCENKFVARVEAPSRILTQ